MFQKKYNKYENKIKYMLGGKSMLCDEGTILFPNFHINYYPLHCDIVCDLLKVYSQILKNNGHSYKQANYLDLGESEEFWRFYHTFGDDITIYPDELIEKTFMNGFYWSIIEPSTPKDKKIELYQHIKLAFSWYIELGMLYQRIKIILEKCRIYNYNDYKCVSSYLDSINCILENMTNIFIYVNKTENLFNISSYSISLSLLFEFFYRSELSTILDLVKNLSKTNTLTTTSAPILKSKHTETRKPETPEEIPAKTTLSYLDLDDLNRKKFAETMAFEFIKDNINSDFLLFVRNIRWIIEYGKFIVSDWRTKQERL
jgi:hypothetical protein